MNRALSLLVLAKITLGVLYSFSTPIFEASDEIWHYPVVREIGAGRGLPIQDALRPARWAHEGSQPPLYYAIAAALIYRIDQSDYEANAIYNPFVKAGLPGATDNVNLAAHPVGQHPRQGGTVLAVYLIRWLSVLLGAVTVILTARLARDLFPQRPALAWLAAALVAFNPMVLFINSAVNNDNLIMALGTLALWLLVRDLQSDEPGPRWPGTFALGAVLGLAALTKVSGLVLLPVAALAITISAFGVRRRAGHTIGLGRTVFVRGATLLAVVLTLAGWWYVRNFMLYGDLLGLNVQAEISGARPPGFGLTDVLAEAGGFWYSFWGIFGGFNILAPAWFYDLVSGLALLAGVGLVVHLVHSTIKLSSAHSGGDADGSRGNSYRIKLSAGAESEVSRLRQRTVSSPHVVLIAFIALNLTSLAYFSTLTHASQGRLLFIGIAPVAVYMALGLLVWLPTRQRAGAAYVAGGALAVCAVVIARAAIVPAYRSPEPLDALPPDATPLNIRFGDDIRLIGYTLSNRALEPGAPFPLTLYWTTDRPIADGLNLALIVFGHDLEIVAKLDTWPGGGLLPTTNWQPGVIYPDAYRLPTDPAAQAPAPLTLEVRFWQRHVEDRLPVIVDGQPQPGAFLNAGRLISPPAPELVP